MKILFISHSYPPVLGGVEIQNYNLAVGLSKISKVKIIANTRGKLWLPVFLLTAALKAMFHMKNYDYCLLGNGVVAPIGALLRAFFPKKKYFCVVHGLDITFASRKGVLSLVYRFVNIWSLKKMERLFMVGNATIEEAVKAGIDRNNCIFIPNGVNPDELIEEHTAKELTDLFGMNVKDKVVLFRLGRFVPHKGTSWFIRKVMPALDEKFVLIAAGNRVGRKTAGDQDDFMQCEQAIINKGLEHRVRLLPSLPWKNVLVLLNTVDLVVSPNIRIPGSMEGFGINVIEAGACGRIVIASDLEGLSDAIKEGENGFLVEPENVKAWTKRINELALQGREERKMASIKAANFVRANFSWDKICARYLDEMKKA